MILAREKHPGQRNSLDALCKRYNVDNQNRILHGALLDANLLAEVYLAMTGGQTIMELQENENLPNKQNKEEIDFFTNKFIEVSVTENEINYNDCFLSEISTEKERS